MSEKMTRTLRINANIFFEVPVSYETTGKEVLFIDPSASGLGVLSNQGNRIIARPVDKETIEAIEVEDA